jgi:hypothetical protein
MGSVGPVAASFFRRHTALHIFCNGQIEVSRHLRVKIAVKLGVGKRRTQTME